MKLLITFKKNICVCENMDTDWGMVADDRINSQLDFSNIRSKEDYLRELNSYLSKTPTGKTLIKKGVLEEMYENSRAKKKIERLSFEEERKSFKKARTFQRTRGLKGKLDQKKTASNTKRPTRKNVSNWMKRPSKSDIKGIDTKVISQKQKLTKKDSAILRKYNIRATINVRGIKQYRDNKGRFVKKSKVSKLKI